MKRSRQFDDGATRTQTIDTLGETSTTPLIPKRRRITYENEVSQHYDIQSAFQNAFQDYQNAESASIQRRSLVYFLRNFHLLTSEESAKLLEFLLTALSKIKIDNGEDRNDFVVLHLRVIGSLTVHLWNITKAIPHEDNSLLQSVVKRILAHMQIDSHRVRRQIIQNVIELFKANFLITANEHQLIFQICNSTLSDWDPGVRKEVLALLAMVCRSKTAESSLRTNVIDILRKYTFDRDPRVRATALNSLITLHSSAILLDVSLYQQAVNCLQDDFQEVREQAMELMYVLAKTYSQQTVVHGNRSMTILEDVYTKLCTMVRDVVVSVRTRACRLLGSLEKVPLDLLMETFSKMQMNYNPSHKFSAEQKQSKHNQQNNRKKTERVEIEPADEEIPDGDVVISSEDAAGDQLLYTGVVGTFVLGLEDQFQSVRIATIQSICAHSLRHKKFAETSVMHLINMFSDDIDAVRIEAIDAVTALGAEFVKLNEEQLQIILVLLEDANSVIRHKVHQLLGVVKLSNSTCMHAAIRALLTTNLNKFPEDINSIYKCLRKLGLNHALFVELLIEELLKLERYILTPEQAADDPYHTGITIVIFNACEHNANIPSHLPAYLSAHYSYLKSKFPYLYPDLSIQKFKVEPSTITYTFNSTSQISDRTSGLLSSYFADQLQISSESEQRVLHNILRSYDLVRDYSLSGEPAQAFRLVGRIRAELSRMSTSITDQSVEFFKVYTKCMEFYLSLMREMRESSVSLNSVSYNRNILRLCLSITYLSYKMETLFSNIDVRVMFQLKCLRFVVHVCAAIANSNNNRGSNSVPYTQIQQMRKRAIQLRQFYESNIGNSLLGQLASPDLVSIIKLIQQLESDISLQYSNATLDSQYLMRVVQQFFPRLIWNQAQAIVKKISCRLTSPESNLEKPATFLSYIPLNLVVRGQIHNYEQDASLYIALRFPDGTYTVYPIQQSDIELDSDSNVNLDFKTEISLTMESWTHASSIAITLVSAYKTDVENEYEELYNMVDRAGNNADLWQVDLDNDTLFAEIRQNFVPISSKHVDYYVHPQDS